MAVVMAHIQRMNMVLSAATAVFGSQWMACDPGETKETRMSAMLKVATMLNSMLHKMPLSLRTSKNQGTSPEPGMARPAKPDVDGCILSENEGDMASDEVFLAYLRKKDRPGGVTARDTQMAANLFSTQHEYYSRQAEGQPGKHGDALPILCTMALQSITEDMPSTAAARTARSRQTQEGGSCSGGVSWPRNANLTAPGSSSSASSLIPPSTPISADSQPHVSHGQIQDAAQWPTPSQKAWQENILVVTLRAAVALGWLQHQPADEDTSSHEVPDQHTILRTELVSLIHSVVAGHIEDLQLDMHNIFEFGMLLILRAWASDPGVEPASDLCLQLLRRLAIDSALHGPRRVKRDGGPASWQEQAVALLWQLIRKCLKTYPVTYAQYLAIDWSTLFIVLVSTDAVACIP